MTRNTDSEKVEERFEELIEDSLLELSRIGEEEGATGNVASRLVFPKYRDRENGEKGGRRISEQELRFLLVRKLEEAKMCHYSVETPTRDKYCFSGEKFLSARIDLCLHRHPNLKRTNLVELKYGNKYGSGDIMHDFAKLLCDDDTTGTNYFVQFVERADGDTISNIEGKYRGALGEVLKFASDHKRKIKFGVKIILFAMETDKATENFHRYEIGKNGILRS